MHNLFALSASWVMPTHTGTEALAILLRWIHLLAGITWVGLLYFFNLVNVPFMKQVDAAVVGQSLASKRDQQFSWSFWHENESYF